MILNEAEVREKILSPWLTTLGFKHSDILLESTFTIQLGRGTKTISGRSDYLIRNNAGINLFILEAKSQTDVLTEEDKNQGISYARLVTEGNIPPFVIVSNGIETNIYDTLTKEKCNDNLFEHPYVIGGFKIESSISARNEALNYLLCLSENNLNKFCIHQVEHRLKPLKSENIYSGKKYIPAIFIRRIEAELKLNELLFNPNDPRKFVLVTGSPQKGKTSFICNQVEELLKNKKINCLFYPAIGLNTGLLSAIKEDFQWVFSDQNDVVHIVHQLKNILNKNNQKLFLFIDGLNEIDQNLALQISHECERISNDRITIILSATSNSLERLLFEYGNPNFLADQSRITLKETEILSKRALQNIDDKNIVQLNDFNEKELKEAINVYSNVYKATVKRHHNLFFNPFLLRVSMELYAGDIIPEKLDEVKLLEEIISLKATRTGQTKVCFQKNILELAEKLFKNDSPLCDIQTLSINANDLQKLYEAAIIAQLHTNNNRPAIDFYYSRERDFVISYLLMDWPTKFNSKDKNEVIKCFIEGIKTVVGQEALRWFFSSQTHFEQCVHCIDLLEDIADIKIRSILYFGMLNQEFKSKEQLNWLAKKIVNINLTLNSSELIEEASIVLYKFVKESGIEAHTLTNNQVTYLKQLMVLESTLFTYSGFEESLSYKLMDEFGLQDQFKELLLDENTEVSSFASLLLVFTYSLLEYFNELIKSRNPIFLKKIQNFVPAVELAAKIQFDASYCDPYQAYEEFDEEWIYLYAEFRDEFCAIMKLFKPYDAVNFFENEFEMLKGCALGTINEHPDLGKEEWVIDLVPELLEINEGNMYTDPNQLSLELRQTNDNDIDEIK